jgi:membrane fusion protein (multidrug efflux system)
MSKGLKIALAMFVLLALFGGIGAYTYMNRVQPSAVEMVAAVEQERQPVKTAVVAPRDVVERLTSTGVLKAERDVVLSAEVAGKVKKIFKELGDRCDKGDLLARLDQSGYRIALAQARAGLKQAEAALEHAGRDQARLAKLEAQAAVTGQQLDAADGAVKSSAAAVEQAKAATSAARRNLKETEIRCPFDGFVAQRMVELGQSVMPGGPIARIVDTSQLRLALAVTAAELARLEVGQRVVLDDPELPDRTFTGTVDRLGVAADELTRSFPVEVAVGAEQDGLRSGQVVRASLELAEHRGVIAVPSAALVPGGEQRRLYTVQGEVAREVEVSLGPEVDGLTLIEAGLAAGDEVVVVGREMLEDGTPVEVVARDGRPLAAVAPAAAPTGAADASPDGKP